MRQFVDKYIHVVLNNCPNQPPLKQPQIWNHFSTCIYKILIVLNRVVWIGLDRLVRVSIQREALNYLIWESIWTGWIEFLIFLKIYLIKPNEQIEPIDSLN